MAISHETQTYNPPGPEAAPASAETIAVAFSQAESITMKITADPRFHVVCVTNGVDPIEGCDTYKYWGLLARYTSQKVAAGREQHGGSLALDALELVSAAPAFMYAQLALDNANPDHPSYNGIKQQLTVYNHRLENFATTHPTTRVSTVKTSMLNMTNKAFDNKQMRRNGGDRLDNVLSGLQQELGFGQILAHTGRSFRKATVDEDGRGFDYIVDNKTPDPLFVDVKSTLEKVNRQQDNAKPFNVRPGRSHVNMISPIERSAFRDSFFIDESLAAERADYLNATLNQAKREAA